ncbi:MAG: MBL fold metallo-hydrolase, partial [Galactobacillus timonensis]|nr:MBL fold metallo-hydrolase [Galactobacillus timonensis]
AFEVHHSVTCYGYSLVLDRAGRFDPVKAAALNIPKKLWNLLQKGNTVTTDTAAFTPDQVMGKPRKGIKVTYCTDTTVCDSIVPAAKDSDLFICEGMYADPARAEAAETKKHMVFTQAAQLAKEADVKQLWLTHFSPAETHPEEGLDAARAVFPNTELGENGKKITLNFQDDAH